MIDLRLDASESGPLPRELTHQVHVGSVAVGGGAPVSVQSMCTTPTTDPAATLAQIRELADLGCEIIRVAIPHADALDGFREVCAESPLPVVADIHFDHRLAIEAARRGASALRINPGNIGSFDRVDAVIDAAGEAGIPIRIGVNAGSLDREIDAREDLTQPQKLVQSAVSFVRHFEGRGFSDIVLSAKVHDVPATILTNRKLSHLLPHVPLHLGVTEAGPAWQGTIKSCLAFGALLAEGIGDTIRVSLSAPPVEEVKVGCKLLEYMGLRARHFDIISCPSCGRAQVDVIQLANAVTDGLKGITAPIRVAVMGCIVNGPGEAREADLGVASGNGKGQIFIKGKVIETVPEDRIVDTLLDKAHEIAERMKDQAESEGRTLDGTEPVVVPITSDGKHHNA